MALQISSGVLPTFLRVMARFFALLESRSVTLLGTFWLTFCLLVDRSMVGPCAFVLNISSNSSTFRSFQVGSRESAMPKNETGSGFANLTKNATSSIRSSSISLNTVPLIWFGFRATQLKTGIRNFVLMGFLILTAKEETALVRRSRHLTECAQV